MITQITELSDAFLQQMGVILNARADYGYKSIALGCLNSDQMKDKKRHKGGFFGQIGEYALLKTGR